MRSEKIEIVNIFKIITYLQNTVSIHPISSGSTKDCSWNYYQDSLIIFSSIIPMLIAITPGEKDFQHLRKHEALPNTPFSLLI